MTMSDYRNCFRKISLILGHFYWSHGMEKVQAMNYFNKQPYHDEGADCGLIANLTFLTQVVAPACSTVR
jgi:hypothetical protein